MMAHELFELPISCPYCGEKIDLLIDGSVEEQKYIEDCQVCCQPIALMVRMADDGRPRVHAAREDDG